MAQKSAPTGTPPARSAHAWAGPLHRTTSSHRSEDLSTCVPIPLTSHRIPHFPSPLLNLSRQNAGKIIDLPPGFTMVCYSNSCSTQSRTPRATCIEVSEARHAARTRIRMPESAIWGTFQVVSKSLPARMLLHAPGTKLDMLCSIPCGGRFQTQSHTCLHTQPQERRLRRGPGRQVGRAAGRPHRDPPALLPVSGGAGARHCLQGRPLRCQVSCSLIWLCPDSSQLCGRIQELQAAGRLR